MAGASDSAWRRPRATSNSPSTPSWPPSAQLTCSVAVSMPRINTSSSTWRTPRWHRRSAGGHPRRQGGLDPGPAGAPTPTAGDHREHPVVGSVGPGRLEPDRHELGPEARRHDVAPLDQHDGVVVLEELAEGEVGHLRGALQAVDVGVVDAEAALVCVDEGEGGAGDGVEHAETGREALRERRLAGAHLAGEEDEVAG